MAKVNTNFQVAYTSDFGAQSTIAVKFGNNIPDELIQAMGYEQRTRACRSRRGFKPRYFEVVLTSGKQHILPIPSLGNLISLGQALVALDIVACVNLEGEKIGNVPASLIGNPTFTRDPIADIPDEKEFDIYQYDYTSDIIGVTNLVTRIESNPTALRDCQASGLSNANIVETGLCGPTTGFSPRKFLIKNVTDDGNRITRQGILSIVTGASDAVSGMTSCAYCVGYNGERQKDIGSILPVAS